MYFDIVTGCVIFRGVHVFFKESICDSFSCETFADFFSVYHLSLVRTSGLQIELVSSRTNFEFFIQFVCFGVLVFLTISFFLNTVIRFVFQIVKTMKKNTFKALMDSTKNFHSLLVSNILFLSLFLMLLSKNFSKTLTPFIKTGGGIHPL